jgi:hypothetical protein
MSGTFNTGHYNTGGWNTGNRNTGHYNAGDRNTGYYNTGDHNTGNRNTGNRNTGYYNTGGWNTGNYNTGGWNTGNYNTGDYHVGCFNTINADKAYYFNKLIDKSEWDGAKKPNWLVNVLPTTWVRESEMTAKEKSNNPSYERSGGYLRKNNLKEEWAKAYAQATPEDIKLTKALPGFDADVFFEITGIDVRDKPADAPCEGREVEIDGVTYVLKAKGEADE